IVPAAASLPPLQLPRASESPVTFHCIGRSSLPPSSITTPHSIPGNFPLYRPFLPPPLCNCHARLTPRYLSIVSAVPLFLPLQLPRASESPVTFHCIGRSSLPPSQLPRASESPVTFRKVHTPQALSSHTIRIREEGYR